jgi:hypothetical protein
MQILTQPARRIPLILLLMVIWPALAVAQMTTKRPLISQPVEDSKLTILRGNRYPRAQAKYDRGAAPASLPMERMMLVLKRAPEQETELDALLAQQQNQSSPNFHAWLTPEQFGQQFGPADQDIQAVTSWLQLHGFQISKVSNGRTVIEFSGTAAQVQSAFHTEIHTYVVNGEAHWANASDPQIPTALTPVVVGIDTLHNFPRNALHHLGDRYTRSKETGAARGVDADQRAATLFTLPTPNGCGVQTSICYALGPYDFATIYDVLPLWNASPTHIDGTGQTIAIVAESNINPQDIVSFRNYFGLPTPPKLNIILDGPDPGLDPGGAETEADLDVEWAGAIAPNATIDLVVSQSTESSLGADLSAVYAVDNNLASVLNVSFGVCELALGTTGNQFFNQLWQQAAAQGITVLVATGDSGSAVCDRDDGPPPAPALFGLSVSGFSSTPYNVAVGGTDFNDLTNATTYWNLSNTAPASNPTAFPTLSAKSYIPETTWNNSCTNGVFGTLLGFSANPEMNCNNPQLVEFVTSVGGSGGKSGCTTSDGQDVSSCGGGYAKPSWQMGTGVPADGMRDVPDVSLFSAVGSPSGSFYIICEADALPSGTSSCDPANPATEFLAIGGTSASAPSFAAIMALVNQKTNSLQGNANYVLYKFAAQQPTAFHDVPAGATIAMPCAKASPDCTVTNSADTYGILSGYSTTAGYDLATGLGSVDANSLVTNWNTVTTKGSATTLSLSPSPVNITHGQSVNLNISVAAASSATGTPTGKVSLIANTAPPSAPSEVTEQGVQSFQLSNGLVSSTTSLLPGGSYTVVAQYPGDGTFGPSDSLPPLPVMVTSESSKTFANLVTVGINGNPTTFSASNAIYGSGVYVLRVDVGDAAANVSSATGISSNCSKGVSSCPTGTVTLTSSGVPLSGSTLSLNSKGYAEDQSLAIGSYAVSASYTGDSSYEPSATTVNFTISKAPTIASASAPELPIEYGNDEQVDAELQTNSDGVEPTGTFTFSIDGSPAQIYSVSYEGFPYQPSTTPPSYAYLDATGLAVFLSIGKHNLTMQYSGDANYDSATSPPYTVSVTQAQPSFSTDSVTPTTINLGQQVTLTAEMFGSQHGVPPTGTMTFHDGNTAISGTVTYTAVNSTSLTSSALQASMTYTPTSPGTHSITVTYSGDANYLSASTPNPPLTLTVVGPSFTVSANPTTVTINTPGSSGFTMLTFTSVNGYSGTIPLSPSLCAGMPPETTCSFSASSLVLNSSSQSATATLTFQTTAPSTVLPQSSRRPLGLELSKLGGSVALACIFCVGILSLGYRNARRWWRVTFAPLAIASLVAIGSCGGGGGGGSAGGGGGNAGTPVQLDVGVVITFSGAAATPTPTLNLSINVE